MKRNSVSIPNILIKEAFSPIGKSLKQRMIMEREEAKALSLIEKEDFIKPSLKNYKDSKFKLYGYEMNYRMDFPLFALIMKNIYIPKKNLEERRLVIPKKDLMRWFEIKNLNPNRIESIYNSFIRIMNLKVVFYLEGDKYPTIQSLISSGKFDNDKNFIIVFNKDFQDLCLPYDNDDTGHIFNLHEKKYFSKKEKRYYEDKTYIDFDRFFKIKNETAMCLYCFSRTHDLKKGFSFDTIKSIVNKTEQKNHYSKKKIIQALDHLQELKLIYDYKVNDDLTSPEWLTIRDKNKDADGSIEFEEFTF